MTRLVPQIGQRSQRFELPAGFDPVSGIFQDGVAFNNQRIHHLLKRRALGLRAVPQHELLHQPVHPHHPRLALPIHHVGGLHQPLAQQPAQQGLPRVGVTRLCVVLNLGECLRHQRPQPRQRNLVRRQQRGKLQRQALRRAQPLQRRLQRRAQALLSVKHRFRALPSRRVQPLQPVLPQPRQKSHTSNVIRILSEIHGSRLDRQRKASQQPHNLLRRLPLRLAPEPPITLVAFDQRQRIVRRQLIHRQKRPVLMYAVEFVFAQPCGRQNVQPVAPIQPCHHRRIQQRRPVHVVQNQQAPVRRLRVSQLPQLPPRPLQCQVRVLLLVVRKLKAHRRSQFAERQPQVVLARAAHLPAPSAILVGKGMRILDGQRSFAQPANPVHRRHHADLPRLHEVLPHHAQVRPPPYKVWVVRVHIAQALLRPLSPLNGLRDLPVERRHPFAYRNFAQRRLALLVPRPQVEVLPPPKLRHPRRAAIVEIPVLPPRYLHKVDRRHSIEPVQVPDLILQVLHHLPLAVLAREIRRRQARQQQPRLSQPLQNLMSPVLHPVNLVLVEKRHKFAPRELGKVLLDPLDKLRNPPLPVVVPRIADEQVVGHLGSSPCKRLVAPPIFRNTRNGASSIAQSLQRNASSSADSSSGNTRHQSLSSGFLGASPTKSPTSAQTQIGRPRNLTKQRSSNISQLSIFLNLVDAVGIEPTTCRLRAECSAS